LKETTKDLDEGNLPISKLRLKALEHAKEMPIADEGSPPIHTEYYYYSQPSISRKSNWLQIGPTAIPDGQTISGYYSDANIPAIVTGRITSIVIDHKDTNVIYLGTAQGGVWKTIDGGRNWKAISDYLPSIAIGALAMDPHDSNTLYAGTGEGNIFSSYANLGSHPEHYYGCGIFKSVLGGKNWEIIGENNPFIGASFYRLCIDPYNTSIIFAATSYGLYRSMNAGKDWTPMSNGLPTDINNNLIRANDIVINPFDDRIAYVAIYGDGVYKSSNANDDNPLWTKLNIEDNREGNIRRISIDISKANPEILYVLMSRNRLLDKNYDKSKGDDLQYHIIDSFFRSIDGGITWHNIRLPGLGTKDDKSPWEKDSIGKQGFYNLNITVDPKNYDIVYLSGTSLWRAKRDNKADTWFIEDIGKPIHPDHHAFAFDPTDSAIIYAGNDGGIYKSVNRGETWYDDINEGLCITQFEFMDHHPTSDAVIFGGTQDNGTLQYRNSPAFYYSDYGDGGFVSIDYKNPNNIIHQYTYNVIYHSKKAGALDSWVRIPVKYREKKKIKDPPSLFYAPFTLDRENPKNIAFGSNKIYLDNDQGLKKWKHSLELSPLDQDELVSAINFVNSDLMYVATVFGKVFRLVKKEQKWDISRIDTDPLPRLYCWDIDLFPDDPNSIVTVMAGYGSQQESQSNIWYGRPSKNTPNKYEWKNISGEGRSKLPSTPINSIVIEKEEPYRIYVGTDIGVFRSSNKGNSWIRFSEGLPNCAVYDMRLNSEKKLLRVITHGRGIWERQLDIENYNDVNLFIRNNIMDSGRFNTIETNVSSAFSDSLQNEDGGIKLNQTLTWDMCPDIKIDSPKENLPIYQFDTVDSVDYVKFESRLQHRNIIRDTWSNIYVQIHNRGIKPVVNNVQIKLFYANQQENKGQYHELDKNFWTSNLISTHQDSYWKQIGSTRILPEGKKTLTNTEPTILCWQWLVPKDIGNKIGILVVVECPEDPIIKKNKIFEVEKLARIERHVGLRTVNVKDNAYRRIF